MKFVIDRTADGYGWRLMDGETIAVGTIIYRRHVDIVRQINRIIEAARTDGIVVENGK